MKKQIQSVRFLLLAGLLSLSFYATANNNAINSKAINTLECLDFFDEVFTYSWAVESGAVNYVVELTNTVTQEHFSWETSQTTISAFGVPNGIYDLKVTAKFADSSASIIIVDVIEH